MKKFRKALPFYQNTLNVCKEDIRLSSVRGRRKSHLFTTEGVVVRVRTPGGTSATVSLFSFPLLFPSTKTKRIRPVQLNTTLINNLLYHYLPNESLSYDPSVLSKGDLIERNEGKIWYGYERLSVIEIRRITTQ